MGVKNWIVRKGAKASDRIAKLSSLSPEQLERIQAEREKYFAELAEHSPNDPAAQDLTKGLLAASSVEIFNAYLPQLSKLYVPISKDAAYTEPFNADYNVRYFNITKWVTDKEENSLEKLINVYDVLSDEDCNIALIFHRTCELTKVYLAVTNNKNSGDNVDANNFKRRLADAVRGNFPGSEWKNEDGIGSPPCLKNHLPYTVATASNIPAEKSEKFISQTIEKLLDGIVPENISQEYTLILLATPIRDAEERKLRLSELYTGLAPYSQWQTNFTYTESGAQSSNATFGVNVGASAGVQNGVNNSVTNSRGESDSVSKADGVTESEGENLSEQETTGTQEGETQGENYSSTHTESSSDSTNESWSESHSDNHNTTNVEGESDTLGGGLGGHLGPVELNGHYDHGWSSSTSVSDGYTDTSGKTWGNSHTDGVSDSVQQGTSYAKQIAKNEAKTIGKTVMNNTARSITNTLGKAVTNTVAKTAGTFKSVNLGGNFGVNFARSSNVTATVGKNEGITQNYTNYTIKHALEVLEQQMKRYELSTALGMWDFAAYVLSEDYNIANNVAHSYIALTQGEESYMSQSSINMWRGDTAESGDAREICGYLRELRHPEFGLNPKAYLIDPDYYVYPPVVTATTALSGKELAYSLNFPKKSVAGLPVIECAEFGRNIVTYDDINKNDNEFYLGKIFHMNHEEPTSVSLKRDSLASHTFITGSTGSGKSNTVYRILLEAQEQGVNFLVIEPAKGEYKHIFGNDSDVSVYGTNPAIMPLLRLDPFSFPEGIHVLEHIDRLVEIFNVCWPMYAAMPAVLKEAVEKSYEDCGWDMTLSVNEYGSGLYPNFADVARNVRQIIDSSEYDAENKGAYKGSLLTRLNSLTNGINGMIFTSNELTNKELFDKNAIVDLSRVGSSETKSLIMGMLVLKLQEHRMTQGRMNSKLEHITVLEEAHNLLKRTSGSHSSEGADLTGKSVEMISNAIAEMRTYGEGFIIADQAPGLLDMAAIRNTNTKIILRLPDLEDRQLVGKAANLNDAQIDELAKLPCGVAAVYQNEWVQPVLCKVVRFGGKESIYRYDRSSERSNCDDSSHERLYIAELLSSGTKFDKEKVLAEITEKLDKIGLSASVKVRIMKHIISPPKEPRMTKLAPIMAEIFPTVRKAVEEAYEASREPVEWTNAAERILRETISEHIDDQVRRDIVQCIITDYVFLQLGKCDDLKKWSIEGGLS